jgi:hypothetical protein
MPTPAELLQQQLDRINTQINQINDQIVDLGDDLGDSLVKGLSKSVAEAKKLKDPLKDAESISKKLVQLADDNAVLQNQLLVTETNFSKALQRGNAQEVNRLRNKKNQLGAALSINNALQSELATLQEVGDIERERLRQENKIVEAVKKQEETYKDFLKNNVGLIGILKALVNIILKADAQATQLAKSFGISKDAAYEIRQNFVEYSRAAEDTFVNTDRLLKAQAGLTEQLGLAVEFSGKEVEQFARLTEIVGLTADEAGKLAKFSAATGVSTDKYVADVREAAFFSQQANKIRISDKELLSTISKLSAGILVKFQNNPKALAQAVIQAKQLGTSLEQIDKTAESLLNFESSIGAELEAELITGRQLNFERARAAALTGDQVTLMEEMAAQAGSLAEYQNMNVIAQQSLAQAFGMSRDEMADMLLKQQVVNQYGDEAAKLSAQQLKDFQESGLSLDKYLEKQDKQRSIQEKFNDAMTHLQDVVGNLVAGPFGQLLNTITDILNQTTLLAAVMGGTLVFNMLKVLNVMKQAKKVSYGEAVISIIKSAYQSIGGLPGVGMVLAGAAAAGGLAYLATQSSKEADDMFSPGYGKRVILSPEGSIALNDRDSIVAGTNLGGGGDGGVIAAIANLTNIIAKQPTPQFALNVSGEQIGAVVGKQQSTGTQQTINSYKLA